MCNLLHISENAAMLHSVISRREFIHDVHGLACGTSARQSFARKELTGGFPFSLPRGGGPLRCGVCILVKPGGNREEALTDDDVFVYV